MPTSLTYTLKDPDNSHGPSINLTWSTPAKPNGIIRNYTVFYSYNGNPQREISGIDVLSYSVDVLGGATYEFHVRAVTIKPGPNATLTVNVPEYGRKTSIQIQFDPAFRCTCTFSIDLQFTVLLVI